MIVVGTRNPVKLAAVRAVASRYSHLRAHEVAGCDVRSGVSEQPKTLEETIAGAIHRAKMALLEWKSAMFAIGIESGVFEVRPRAIDPSWVSSRLTFDVCACAVLHPYDGGGPVILQHVGLSQGWEVPFEVTRQIYVFGKDMDGAFLAEKLTDKPDLGIEEGAIGVLTRGVVDRQAYTESAIVMALIGSEAPEGRWTIYP